MSTCGNKVRYKTFEDARQASLEYNHRVVFADMNPYHCTRHRTWHIGHFSKYQQYHPKAVINV